jgi:hypothetical protein
MNVARSGSTTENKQTNNKGGQDVNFTNILQATFLVLKCFAQIFSNYNLALYFLVERILAQKLLVKCQQPICANPNAPVLLSLLV